VATDKATSALTLTRDSQDGLDMRIWAYVPDVEANCTNNDINIMDNTTVRGHRQAAGAKGGLARRVLVEAGTALLAKSTPAQTVKDALSASS
jgi:hypothetical protein